MTFANIDEAIAEAAKKKSVEAPATTPEPVAEKPAVPAKKAVKPAPKKKVVEPTPAVPAKKAEAPKPKKKVEPTPVAPKKVEKPKKTVVKKVSEPQKKEEPAKEPEQKPAETKPTQSSDSRERPKFAPRWLQSKPRGIGDRLKTAWKGFTAKAGDKIDVPHKYKSVFHEIQKLMEQLQLVEIALREQTLYENTAEMKNKLQELHTRKHMIRKVLAEQIIREELYKHNVTVAELNQRQRAALIETVKQRSSKMWEELNELSPNLLARYSNKVGDQLTKTRDDYDAKRMGDAEVNARLDKRIKGMGMAQQSIEKRAQTPQGATAIEKAKDQDKTATAQQSFDKGLDKAANAELSVRSAQQAKQEREKMGLKFEESYTLEELLGMIKEVGYKLHKKEQ